MVFEQIYRVEFLRRQPWFAFFLGVGYSVLGVAIALSTFPQDPALIAVAIISILFIPSFSALMGGTERQSRASARTTVELISSTYVITRPAILIYIFAFLGMFLVFAFFALALPQLATNVLFKQQLDVLTGPTGHAIAFSPGLMQDLLINNFLVLMLCFVISVIAGNGSILFIAWNASVWGTIFGTLAKASALQIQGSPVIIFVLIMFSVVPHMMIEIISYILGASSGTLLSDGLVNERLTGQAFSNIMRRVMVLFIAAIAMVVLGAVVETFVLGNFTTYARIIDLSFGR